VTVIHARLKKVVDEVCVIGAVKSTTRPDKIYEVIILIDSGLNITACKCDCEDRVYRARICKHCYELYKYVTGRRDYMMTIIAMLKTGRI